MVGAWLLRVRCRALGHRTALASLCYDHQTLRTLRERGLRIVHMSLNALTIPEVVRLHKLPGGDCTVGEYSAVG